MIGDDVFLCDCDCLCEAEVEAPGYLCGGCLLGLHPIVAEKDPVERDLPREGLE